MSAPARPRRGLSAAEGGIVALFVLLRVATLTADPAARLVSHYQDVAFSVFDEGWWTGNARQWALTHHLLGTGFDLFWVSPVFTLVEAAAFGLLGVHLAVARLVSVLFGALGVALLLSTSRAPGAGETERRAALFAALLCTVSFAGAQLGKLALPETTGTALGLAGAVGLLGRRGPGFVLAGVFAALAALTKPHFAFLLPAFGLSTLALARPPGVSRLAALAAFAMGALVPLAAWGVVVGAHAHAAADIARFYGTDRWFASTRAGLGALIGLAKPFLQVLIAGVIYRHPLFVHFPATFFLAAAAAPLAWVAALRGERGGASPALIVFGLWALFGWLAVSTLPFQPLRYYLPLVPALAYLAAWSLVRSEALPLEREPSRLLDALRLLLLAVVVAQVVFAALSPFAVPELVRRSQGRVALLSPVEFHLAPFLVAIAKARSLAPFAALPRELAYLGALALVGAASLGAGVLLALGARQWLARGFPRHPFPDRAARALLGVIVAYEAFLWITWLPARAATLPQMARTLDATLPRGSVVSPGGVWSLDSRLRYDSNAVREGRMFDGTGATSHFVVLCDHPLIGHLADGEIERRFPGSSRLATFTLTGNYVYALYAAAPRDTSAASGAAAPAQPKQTNSSPSR